MHPSNAEVFEQAGALGVTIQQRSKTVWIATGTYRGHEYEVKGRTPSVALALWMEAVQYRGTSI